MRIDDAYFSTCLRNHQYDKLDRMARINTDLLAVMTARPKKVDPLRISGLLRNLDII